MAQHHDRGGKMRDHSLDFSVDREVGIQLTDQQLYLQQKRQQRKPFETQNNRADVNVVMTTGNRLEMSAKHPAAKPSSAASTSVVRKDQRAFLRNVLASKKNSNMARTTVSTSDDPKAYLRQMLASSKSKESSDSAASTSSSLATSTQLVCDQKALLRKLLQKTKKESSESNQSEKAANTVLTASIPLEQKSTLLQDQRATLKTTTRNHVALDVVVQDPSAVNSTARTQVSTGVSEEQEIEQPKSLLTDSLETEYFRARQASSKFLNNDGYEAFLDVLKREVAGDHTELWKSFQTLFHDDVPPMVEKPPKTKFDETTKKLLTEMNLYLKRSYDVECVTETQLVSDRKLVKKDRSVEEIGSVKRNIFARESKSDSLSTTRQHLEAAKRRLLEKDEESRQNSMASATSSRAVSVSVDFAAKSDRTGADFELPEWPDADEPARVSLDSQDTDVSNKENCDGPPTQCSEPTSGVNANAIRSDASRETRAMEAQNDLEEEGIELPDTQYRQPSERRKSWLTVHREKHAMKTSDLLDQSVDSLPDRESSAEESEVLESKTFYRPLQKETGRAEVSKPNESQKSWLSAYREQHAMKTSSLLDQSVDSLPDQESSAEESEVLEPNSFHRPLQKETGRAEVSKPYESQKSWLSAYREKHAMTTSSLLDQAIDSLPDRESSAEESEVLEPNSFHRPLQKETEERADVSNDAIARPLSSKESSSDFARETSVLDIVVDERKAETGTQRFASGVKRVVADSKSDVSENVVPWADVKLRSTPKPEVKRKRQDLTMNTKVVPSSSAVERTDVAYHRYPSQSDSNQPQSDVEEEGPPWGSVKLRSVANHQDATDDTIDKRESPGFRRQLRKVPSDLNPIKLKAKNITLNPEKKTLADLSWARVHTEAVIAKPTKNVVYGISVGDEVNLRNLPAEAFGSQNDSTLVDLDRIPGMPDDHKMSVVIGKNMLLTARSANCEQLSRVAWCIARSNVKSLTLEMAERRADLSLANGTSISLVFNSAEGCLRFANAFYETLSQRPIGEEEERHPEPAETKIPDPRIVATEEKLSEEEQQLLKAYRHKRRTKAPEEAMREAFAAEGYSPKAADSKSSVGVELNADEEKIASTYRQMLEFQVDPEAVRHKMTKDGVSDMIVASVLGGATKETKPAEEGLSDEEEKIAETYRKMLKLFIPPEAVRHKMTMEQVDSRIVDAVLGSSSKQGETDQNPKPVLSELEEALVVSYQKMLKMMIPPEAVRHKMKKDQASQNVIVAVFGPQAGYSGDTSPKQEVSLSEEDEAVASSYRKMLKMMIPPEAVRHKMNKDQVDAKIVMAVLGSDPNEKKGRSPEKALSEADEQIAETYRKKLRMKVPRDDVRHEMIKTGVREKIITVVLGAQPTTPKAKVDKVDAKTAAVNASKLVSLHWTPLSGEALDNSVWRTSKKRKESVAQPGRNDISQLVELFQKKTNNRKPTGADSGNGGGKGNDMAKLLDLNRSNNLAISLMAFKDLSHQELADTIAHLDPLRKITGERVHFMKDLLPTPTEVKTIKEYSCDDSRLVPAEKFFKILVKVPRLQTKVQVMQTMDTLNDNASELGKNFVVLERVCSQIMNSEKLEEVLDMVLQIGNIMNEGTRTGGAAGFKFDSLLKLTQTKSSDGKMTVLDYIVMIFVAKEKRETLQLTSDFPDCQVASRMLITDMVNDVNTMKNALKKCETELENLRKDSGQPVDNGSADPRAALLAAIKKKASSGEEPATPKGFSKREAFLSATEAKKLDDKLDKGSPAKKSFVAKDGSLKSGMQRLEAFITDTKDVLKNLEEERDRAIDACKSLSRYCGESGGERATSTLIGILSEFAMNLESAVQKHDVRKEEEQRREAAAQKKKEQLGTKPEIKPSDEKKVKTFKPVTQGQSLVLMVNELLKETSDEAKEDFKNGIVYEDPDEKLKAIYQRERESLGIFVPPDARKPSQVDLLIAIKKRRERAEARKG